MYFGLFNSTGQEYIRKHLTVCSEVACSCQQCVLTLNIRDRLLLLCLGLRDLAGTASENETSSVVSETGKMMLCREGAYIKV